ncbi:hypothetical protein ACKI1I_35480 [Streptomyces turgidiscabies]|uniref:Putative lipoprotein n=1 Tax=Streptomyces turgidiscabies (strain Car8) TaxID=698760 RepID=L7F6W1_STRT8|nr:MULTISPECIES: hypothetical protein [Streptomyces]ELP67002.1 putative lipoprotein [Streptomyces turgidiscabies Car8]MDX3495782.1 hypothetical protein [Streptomyces turgidiscabies]GAQ75444.1 hypothetical protein T45_07229 [Streptomyces turgidiscabies]
MRATSAGTRVLVTVVAGLVLAGCGGSAPEKSADARDSHEDGQVVRPLAELTVPAAYDGARGWDQELAWVPKGAETVPVAVAPGSGTVAYVVADQAETYVQTRKATTGKVLWTSAPWAPPGTLDDLAGYDPAATAPASVIPVSSGGREYFVAWAHGLAGKDELHDGKEIVQIAVYAADASGDAVAPLRTVDVPVTATDGTAQGEALVRDGGAGRALVNWAEGNQGRAAAVDVTSGKVSTWDEETEPVVGFGGQGPVTNVSDGGFGVPGGWSSKGVAPEGSAETRDDGVGTDLVNGTAETLVDGKVVASWMPAGGDSGDGYEEAVRTVHDATTGKALLRAECRYPTLTQMLDTDDTVLGDRVLSSVSPSGRYLAYGWMLFDIQKGSVACLAKGGGGDDGRKDMVIDSVRDDGTAYGTVVGSNPRVAVEIPASTGIPKALPAGTEVPAYTPVGAGVFLTWIEGGGMLVSGRVEG